MKSPQKQLEPGQHLLACLEASDCRFCDEGTLVSGQFKGNTAVLCDSCGNPVIQMWGSEP